MKNKKYQQVLLFAVIIRILIMPFFIHPDIKTYNFQASFLKGGVFNIYKYLDQNKETLPYKEEFVYQPLSYLFLGGYQILARPFLGKNFESWLWDASQQSVERVGLYRYLFILKLPLLLFDILAAFLITLSFKKRQNKFKAFSLWLLNPLTPIVIYIFANIDIIPVFLVLTSFLFAKKKRVYSAAIILSIAALFKTYPILFLPILAISTRDWKKAFYVFALGVVTFVLPIVPFWSASFKNAALVSGLTTRIFQTGISLDFGEQIVIPVLLYTIIFFFYLSSKRQLSVEYYALSVLIILFSFMHYHIQWLLWMMPFFVLILIKKPRLRTFSLFFISFSFLLPFLYDDKSMSTSLFSAYSYNFTLVPTPFSVVQRFYDVFSLQSIVHSLVAGVGLLLTWKTLNYQKS